MGNIYTGSNSGKAGLNVKKADNTVDVFGVNQIQLGGNMTLVNNQNGSVTIDSTGGGGSGGVTELSFGGTGFLPATSQTGSIVMTGTLLVTSGGTGADNAADARTNLGAGTMSNFTLSDGSNTQTVGDGETITVTGGTGLTSVVSATDTVTIDLDDTAVTAASYTNASITVDAQGRLTSASSGTAPATGTGVANQVAFWDSASTITGDTGLTYVSTAGSRQLKITDTGVDDMLVIESTDNVDTNAPDIKLYRNSNSPFNGDLIGAIKFNANEGNTFTELTYARIESRIDSAGLATYGGSLDFYITNDTQEVRMLTISGETSGVPNMSFDVNPDGDVDGDFRHFSLGGTVNIFSDAQTRTLDIAPIKNYGFGGTSTPLEGQLLIGNGTTFSKSSLTSTGGTIIFDVSTTPGTINLETAGGGGTPAGANTEIQFNNSGAFGANSGLTYNNSLTPPLLAMGSVVGGVATEFRQNAGSSVVGPPPVTTPGGSITSSTSEISLGFNSGVSLANELHGLKLQPTDYQVKTGKTTTQSFGQTQNTIIGATGVTQVVDCYPSQGGLIVVIGNATAITVNLTLGQFAAAPPVYDSGSFPFNSGGQPFNTSNLAGYGTWQIGDQVTVLANLTLGQVPNIVIRSYNSTQNGSLGVSPSTAALTAPTDNPSTATKINGVLSDSITSPAGVKTITTNYTALTFILCQALTLPGAEWVAIG